ncbi:hypothetical protein CACET_c15870 [Clostridium aceticum]|uniref:Uncharacterized protein n=1 Tax=Clostridium aceticum TaxID=84022 RepID=A0A0G3W8R8_9CLOT|nr:hypothetical protein CACET_c15870 [Clostridium aceticum]
MFYFYKSYLDNMKEGKSMVGEEYQMKYVKTLVKGIYR